MSHNKVTLDLETRSVVDLKKAGVYRYAEHESTGIWMASFAFDDNTQDVQRWHPGDPEPVELLEHIRAGRRVIAHNANFERQLWNCVLHDRYYKHWPILQITQMDCTMARALVMHLPPDLDRLGSVLGLSEKKDQEGAKVMRRMYKEQKAKKGDLVLPEGCYRWNRDVLDLLLLGDYCDQDVRTEMAADRILPPLSPAERRLWEIDQAINDRGIMIDIASVERAIAVLEIAQQNTNARIWELTDGAIVRHSEGGRLIAWLNDRGIRGESIAKAEMEELLAYAQILDDPIAVEVLLLRIQASKNSTAKLKRMKEVVCEDGRARGLLNYHRASTGRWGGSLIQPHNLPRVDADKELPAVLKALAIMEEYIF